MPPQYNFSIPNAAIDLANSPFDIPLVAAAWQPNVSGLPRRAAVDGFGFGGANGHAILEAFEPALHKELGGRARPSPAATTLAFVAVKHQAAIDANSHVLGLPDQRQLLPEALQQMDVSQRVMLANAERALKEMKLWAAHKERIGVALGLVGKTSRGAAVTQRIYLMRVLRLLEEQSGHSGIDREAIGRLTRRLADVVMRETLASNPFTLVGSMPNFCAARIANMFDLNGPSVVIDAGSASLLEALRQAHLWLAFGDADVVLTGGIDGAGASCLLAVTTPKLARAHDWVIEVLAQVDDPDDGAVTLRAPNAEPSKRVMPMEATFAKRASQITGIAEVLAAIDATKKGKVATLRWRADQEAVHGAYAGQSVTTSGSASQV